MNNTRVFRMSFASVYPLYVQKAEKRGRIKEDAPPINPNASKITGVICGYRVEEIEDKLMQKIRYVDKLVDELAKGKKMDKILRA